MPNDNALALQQLADEFCEFNRAADRTILHNYAGWLAARGMAAPLGAAPSEAAMRGLRGFLSYIADIRAGRVKRLDRDVVLSYAEQLEQLL